MTNFNIFDKVLRYMRCKKFMKYIPKNGVVCDFGCGEEFWFLKTISHCIKKGIGVDKKYKLKNYKNIEIVDDIKKIKNDSVDLVTMIAVIEHLNNPYDILIELKRILKRGGKIIITTPTPLSQPILEFLAYKLKVINEEEIRDHKQYFGRRDLLEMFVLVGFKKIIYKKFQCGLNGFLEARK